MNKVSADDMAEKQQQAPREGFAWRTTFHGLHFVFWPHYATPRRVIWGVLWGLACLLFIYTMAERLTYYFVYPVDVRSHQKWSQTPPPLHVTLCNLNPLSLTQLSDRNLYTPLNSLLTARQASVSTDSMDQMSAADFWKTLSQSKDNFILSCTWGDKACSSYAWNFTGSHHGACYTFTPPDGAQPMKGLSLILNLASYDAVPALAEDEGVQVYIHGDGESPWLTPGSPDLYLTPGLNTHATIATTRLLRLAPPYGDCSESGGGLRDCVTQQVYQQCACVPFYLKGADDTRTVCNTTTTFLCPAKADVNPQHSCMFSPCEETLYDASVTQTRLSTARLTRVLDAATRDRVTQQHAQARAAATKHSIQNFPDFGELKDHVAQATIRSRPDVREETASPAYTLSQLFKDIGVHLVIFLGASILSLVEIFDFLIEICLKFAGRN